MNKVIFTVVFAFLSVQLYASDKPKLVVGETAVIAVANKAIQYQNYLARIDTGARITSIHAVDISIEGASSQDDSTAKDNIGKLVTFISFNAKGKKQNIEAIIADVVLVRNAQGLEYRYVIELSLNWQGFEKVVTVNLRDRSEMNYKLLIGRNWLHNDVVVDVDKNEGIIQK